MKQLKSVKNNIIFGFGTKIIILAISIIVPRLFIVTFGSEVNGLISTVTQIFTYLALLEAGIGNATVNALYMPLLNADEIESSIVLTQSRNYFRKVSVIYALCVIVFAFGYSFWAKSSIDNTTIFLIILFQGIANCLSYYYCAVYDQLLMASGKRYVTDNIVFVVQIITTTARIVLIMMGYNVIIVQAGYMLLTLIKIPLTIAYCKNKYKWINFSRNDSKNRLQERGAFVIHEISSTIFSNTDVFIISTFCSFSLASVYTVYNLVFASLYSMINTANQGLGFVLGQNLYREKKEFEKIYDCYSMLYSMVVFICMTVAMILIIPFVKLYTSGANDIEYVMQGLPLLFCIINIMSGFRAVAARLITVSGHAGATQNRSITEMIVNLSSSLILVNIFGIYGVLFGTIIALLYRSNDIIIYANKKILKRNPIHEYKNIGIFFAVFIIVTLVSGSISLQINNYFSFAIRGLLVTFVISIIYIIVSIPANWQNYKFLLSIIKGKNQI